MTYFDRVLLNIFSGRHPDAVQTSTNEPPDTDGLTVEKLEAAINAILPVLLYRTSEYAPRANPDDFKVMVIPEFAMTFDLTGKRQHTGREIAILHPDDFPLLQERARGRVRLEEWMPQEER